MSPPAFEGRSDQQIEKRRTHLLLVAHEPLASAFRALALHAFPDAVGDITAVDIGNELSIEEAERKLSLLLAECDRPLLALTDVLGATPANALQRALQARPEVPCVSGLNLPMLWRTLGYRHEPPPTLAGLAREGGVRGICTLNPTNLNLSAPC